MNPEFQHDYGISLVAATSPSSSQVSRNQGLQPQPSLLPENQYTQASQQKTIASKFSALPLSSLVLQLVLKRVVSGVIATLLGFLGLTSNDIHWELDFQLKISPKSNQVEEATQPQPVEKPTELTSTETIGKSK